MNSQFPENGKARELYQFVVSDRRVRFRMKLFHIALATSTGDQRDALDRKFLVL